MAKDIDKLVWLSPTWTQYSVLNCSEYIFSFPLSVNMEQKMSFNRFWAEIYLTLFKQGVGGGGAYDP